MAMLSPDDELAQTLLEEFGPGIRRCLTNRNWVSLSSEDVEDVLAEAVVKIWRYSEKHEVDMSRLRQLFTTAAINLARDVVKRKLIRREAEQDAGTSDKSAPVSPPSGQQLETLSLLLEKLSERERTIILHWANHGHSLDPGQANQSWTRELLKELEETSPDKLRQERLRIFNRIKKGFEDRGFSLS